MPADCLQPTKSKRWDCIHGLAGSRSTRAEALDAQLISSRSDRGDWVWQDYRLEGDARLAVGLFRSDEYEKAPGFVSSDRPIVWMAAKIEDGGQEDHHAKLEERPPAEWFTGRRWYERPSVWRPLTPVLRAPTFDEQREALARAVSVGRDWVKKAIAE